ncbi:MAG TPA: hypothetical protein VH251_12405, partial [Verrucomicrobiae bacterium]|nr:hypothetical protein [Verrucomicrobiae bacterium]
MTLAANSVDGSNNPFFFLLLKIPPVCAPNAVNPPAELFQDPLPRAVACPCNEGTVVGRAITF